MVISILIRRAGNDQLWAKPMPTFEPGAGFCQVCLMFARFLLDRVLLSVMKSVHYSCVKNGPIVSNKKVKTPRQIAV